MNGFTVDIPRLRAGTPQATISCGDETPGPAFNALQARVAQRSWAELPVSRRLQVMGRLRERMVEEAEALAKSSASLRNRPHAETLTAEVLPLVEACRFLERRAAALLSPCKPSFWSTPWWLGWTRSVVMRVPHGRVLIVAPSNYPLFLPAVQALQALVAGNAVCIKPAPGCLGPVLLLQSLLKSSGLPHDLLQVLPDTVGAFQDALQTDIDKVVLTGSASTGTKVMAQLAPRLIPSTMELSGCDPVFILPDADLELAAKALAFGQRLNGGATCIAPKRVFVPEELATELEGRLAREFAAQPATQLDPGDSQNLRTRLQESLKEGAHLVSGNLHPDGSVRGPIVLAETPGQRSFFEQEYFGPVMTLTVVKTEREALDLSRRSPYGLGASIFTKNIRAAQALARRLDVGTVVINDMIAPTADPRLPFGGRRKSGFGSTRGPQGLLEMTTLKVVTCTWGRQRPHFDPPQNGDELWILDALHVFHGRGFLPRLIRAVRLVGRLTLRSRKKNQHKKDTP